MEMVGDRLFYVGSNSIIFVHDQGNVAPPTASFVGDLTKELKLGQLIRGSISLGECNIRKNKLG